jgi:hypothetical protein
MVFGGQLNRTKLLEIGLSMNEAKVISMLTIYSSKDTAFYTRHEYDIK